MTDNVLSLFQPAVSRWFYETFAEPTPPQILRLAAHCGRREHANSVPNGFGKDVGGVPLCHRRSNSRRAST